MVCVSLDELPLRQPALIEAINWSALSPADARRLRDLGFDEGVLVELLHRAPFSRDPIACKVGRMMIAVRRAHAAAIKVEVQAP